MDVRVVEVRRGADRKLYPARPLTREERIRARRLAHNLHCRDGLAIRQVQATMLTSYGIRRSRGAIGNDLKRYECPSCASPPADPAPEPQEGVGTVPAPAAVHQVQPGYLTSMLADRGDG